MDTATHITQLIKEINVPESELSSPYGRLAHKLKIYNPSFHDIHAIDSIRYWRVYLPTTALFLGGISCYTLGRRFKWYNRIGITALGALASPSVAHYIADINMQHKFNSSGYKKIIHEWIQDEQSLIDANIMSEKRCQLWISCNKELVDAFGRLYSAVGANLFGEDEDDLSEIAFDQLNNFAEGLETGGERLGRLLKTIKIPVGQEDSFLGRVAINLHRYKPTDDDIDLLESFEAHFSKIGKRAFLISGITTFALAKRIGWRWYSNLGLSAAAAISGFVISTFAYRSFLVGKLKHSGYNFEVAKSAKEAKKDLRLSKEVVIKWRDANPELYEYLATEVELDNFVHYLDHK
ncbi:hypothetical protein HDV06_001564 [Boothiomyces sp. JEL0866]|nr:hypothetical protein HDV06_001564 [Boothiomyces sp. JEL0866]